MATPQDELQAFREQLAALTARIYHLEQRAGLDVPSEPEPGLQGRPQRH